MGTQLVSFRSGRLCYHPAVSRIRVVGLLHVADRHLLLTRSKGKDGFYLPDGKLNPRESELDALRREIREELGCELTADPCCGHGYTYEPAAAPAERNPDRCTGYARIAILFMLIPLFFIFFHSELNSLVRNKPYEGDKYKDSFRHPLNNKSNRDCNKVQYRRNLSLQIAPQRK